MPFLSSSVISALNIIRGGGAAGVPGILLLDLYPNASAAYSLRKLKTAYTGAAIEVRIDTTGQPVYDIGFDSNGDLDTADLLTKAGANDAYVSKWYDQSGNGLDTINPTASIQPQIVSSGSIITEGDLPTIDFNGDYLFNAGNFNYNGGVSIFSVFNSSVIAGGARIVSDDITGVQGNFIFYSDSTVSLNDNGSGFNNISYSATNGNQLRTLVFNDSTGDYNILQNVSSLASGTLSGWTGPIAPSGASNIGIMASGNGAQTLVGTMQELIVWGNNQSSNRLGIQTNINSNYQIYWDGSQTGLLDDYPDATAAYSLRALSSQYTGPLIKVRRSSDNVEQDIYALYNGGLDTESLLNFVGVGDGFVSTWYDQSGNGDNAIRTTDSEQPQIVSGGLVVEVNNKPSVDFDANIGVPNLKITSEIPVVSAFTVYKVDVITNANVILGTLNVDGDVETTAFVAGGVGSGGWDGLSTLEGTNIETLGVGEDLNQHLGVYNYDSTNDFLSLDGSPLTNVGTNALSFRVLGNLRNFPTNSLRGRLQEVIIYPSDQSANKEGIESNINSNYNIYWDGSQTGLLDSYPSASAAYSLRALSSAYTGEAIRVRRSSDNVEQDIGLLYDGSLDTEGLLDFVGANNGFVTKWYDQSGNGNDAVNGAASTQPVIVTSGAVETLNGSPAIFADNKSLTVGSVNADDGVGQTSSFGLLNVTSDGIVISLDNSPRIARPFQVVSGNLRLLSFSPTVTTAIDNVPYTNGTNAVASSIRKTGSLEVFNNGFSNGSTASGLLATGATALDFFHRTVGVDSITGHLAEYILYPSDQSANRTGIESNINSNYNIYWDGSQTGLLDDYPDATTAYSLRALSSAYTGPAIEVRKTVGGVTSIKDIGFLYDGSLDTASLLSFADGEDVFVAKWYDQSGNGNNATNVTASEQPQIVSSGSVINQGSLPTLDFAGAQQLIKSSTTLSDISLFTVMTSNNVSSEMTAINFQDGTNICSLHFNRSTNNSLVYGSYNGTTTSQEGGNISGQLLASGFSISNASANLFIDGVDVNQAYLGRTNFGNSTIGSRSASYWLTGNVSEVIYYDSNKSANRTEIETNINNYYSIYP